MRSRKIASLARARRMMRFSLQDKGTRRMLGLDFGPEQLGLPTGDAMFEGMEVGMIVVLETFSFPHIGEVVSFNDVAVTLKNMVRVLYDGRHGQLASGAKAVPASAEIEASYPLFTFSIDDVRGWGAYPGGKIPKPQ